MLGQNEQAAGKTGRAGANVNSAPEGSSQNSLFKPVQAPTVSLPKGGGAILGIGEKFSSNPVTGTGSMSVPIATSPGRFGFGPQLSLSYDSGSGNSAYGFGWSLSLPAITRKTDKGLPQYQDAEESDIFILSGAEDLMPALQMESGAWQRDISVPRTLNGQQYLIHRYRPRTEGLFARIERWANIADPTDSFWRSITRDNVTTWYGKTSKSRVADPANPSRIFTWLICESYDDKGNAICYRYKQEDSTGVDRTQAHERNRTDTSRSAQWYLKRVCYGNRTPYFPLLAAQNPDVLPTDWCFELVFDFGEHDLDNPTPQEAAPWLTRFDPFSTYRPTFEVRTYRLCRRALMFHHLQDQANVDFEGTVKSTDLIHAAPPADPTVAAFSYLLSVTQTSYPHVNDVPNSLPPVEFEYSDATIDETVRDVDARALENLPQGIDGAYRWVDLNGEGLSGILTEQGGNWFYKANLSAGNQQTVKGAPLTLPRLAPIHVLGRRPSGASLDTGQQQLLDLSGNGHLDLVEYAGATPGFYERTGDSDWAPFQEFRALPAVDWQDPNLKFIDLTGDGFPDLLISEDDAFSWYSSKASEGFDEPRRVLKAFDEEKGPKLVFADGTETIFLADFTGDGLTDLVRIRNGEVCYWPNTGYGHFGSKITMDRSPLFDSFDQFDGRRVRVVDIDGSGTTDIVYFASGAVHLYFNQSGNRWGARRVLQHFPAVESLSSAGAFDLLGSGTACLVWSSPLPGSARQPLRYIDLMSAGKPHLLTRTRNNLGSETVLQYAPSTKFYVNAKLAGTPWATRLPFPVHVVEQVQTYDFISRNLFVSQYAYHHGYYDGVEREFRGFGRVDQWDTQQFATLNTSDTFPQAANISAASHVPPTLVKTWFHTGAYFGADRISKHMEHEYYSEGDAAEGIAGLTSAQLEAMLLPDTSLPTTVLLPDGIPNPYTFSVEEFRQACRALRGSILRQEIYALDDTEAADRPYSVSERNYRIETLQPCGPNRYGVFFTHASETVDFEYDRKLYSVAGKTVADPRVQHSFVLAVDQYGNTLQTAAVAYGRRHADSTLLPQDQPKQTTLLATYAANAFTNAVLQDDAYRLPLPAQTESYELLQLLPAAYLPGVTNLLRFDELQAAIQSASDGSHDIAFENASPALAAAQVYRRPIGAARIYYRPDDMGAVAGDPKALLKLGQLESHALPGSSYQLALTAGLIAQVYQRNGTPLLPAPAVLASVAPDGGGYVDLDSDGWYWVPSGRSYFMTGPPASPQEFNQARANFYVPVRFEDPFGSAVTITYDRYKLLVIGTSDALNNNLSATNDYRVLAPNQLTDPNGNQVQVTFDTLGLVAETAVMGKTSEKLGDLVTGAGGTTQTQVDAFYDAADPHTLAASLLGTATTRILYDVHRFYNSRQSAPTDCSKWLAPFAATLVRETHLSDLIGGQTSKIQISFSYSDGFGREILRKIQAEPGPVIDGGPVVNPRWAGSGWTIYNNKGKPVRQYEPYFSQLAKGHQFEFGTQVGVSPILFYDPVDRVVATVHPNHTFEKVVLDPWIQKSWDVNDTILETDPTTDPDAGDFFKRLPLADYSPTWYVQRSGGSLGALEQDAANKAAVHANTPSVVHLDTLGRAFLTIADNGAAGKYPTRFELDIQNNQRAVRDAIVQAGDQLGRVVMRYDFDLLQNGIHQTSMEAGERWTLRDCSGKAIRAWDTRGHNFRTTYDELRRRTGTYVLGTDATNSDPRTTAAEVLFEKTTYGEGEPTPEKLNLRTRVYQHVDSAGVVTSGGHNAVTNQDEGYDFKGNLLRSSRALIADYKALPNWSAPPATVETFMSSSQFDALNRPVTLTSPDGSIVRPTLNEANLLEAVVVNLRGAATATSFITNIDYNAKGQRLLIEYANATSTAYMYDPLTFRLTRILTTRSGFQAGQATVQDLNYTLDPAGNITHIQDNAQQTVFFANKRVEPSNDYTYDAIYRLIQATGREHFSGGVLAPTSYNDVPRVNVQPPDDGTAMGIYQETYHYDAVGNFTSYVHKGSDPANPGWTRSYEYSETSLLEAGKQNNRLSRTTVSGATPLNEPYTHDPHGSMTSMPHLQTIAWNFKDEMLMTQRQAVNGSDADGSQHQGERTYYVYNAAGERVRKTTESAAGNKLKERLYLGGSELYREFDAAGTVTLSRETLHVMDDSKRVAVIETKTLDAGGAPAAVPSPAIRYQLDNHLGTACLELDELANLITYEEYYPYGSTSYQFGRTAAETSLKRYRYTAKERDEENGLTYHGARYYAEWLGRWIGPDPAGLTDALILYAGFKNNPVKFKDPDGRQSIARPASGVDPPPPPPPPSVRKKEEPPVQQAPPVQQTSPPPPPAQEKKDAAAKAASGDVQANDSKRPSKEDLEDSVPLLSFFLPVPSAYVRPYQTVPQGAPNGLAALRMLNGQPGIGVANFSRDIAPGTDVRQLTMHFVGLTNSAVGALAPLAGDAAKVASAAPVVKVVAQETPKVVDRAQEIALAFYDVASPGLQKTMSSPRLPVTFSTVTREGITIINVNNPKAYAEFLEAAEKGLIILKPGEIVGSPPIPSAAVPNLDWGSPFLHAETQGELELSKIFDLSGTGAARSYPNPGCYYCVPHLDAQGVVHLNPKP